MKKLNNGNLKLAVQKKGRLTDDTVTLLKGAGLEFESYSRQLFARCRNYPLDIIYLRDDDIPEYVAKGAVDLGIVGENVLCEEGSDVAVLAPLGFGYCYLSLAVPKEAPATNPSDLCDKRIATSYPRLSAQYLKRKKINAGIVSIRGSVEIAPALSMAEGIIDLVSTGSTLTLNDLRVIEKIRDFQTVLIARKGMEPEKQVLAQKLLMRINGIRSAGNYKYVMMNAPRSALAEIKAIVPGLKAPTVSALSDEEWISVQTVIKEDVFWETIERLKNIGANGILVLPIEKLII